MCVGVQPHVSKRFGASQFSAPDCCGAKKITPNAGFKTWLERLSSFYCTASRGLGGRRGQLLQT
jgi:hypothetical protein